MKKYKKSAGKLLNLGMSSYMGAMVTGALPNPTNNANIGAIQTNMATGYANFSSAFPTVGTLAGTGMTMKYAKNLTGVLGSRKKKR